VGRERDVQKQEGRRYWGRAHERKEKEKKRTCSLAYEKYEKGKGRALVKEVGLSGATRKRAKVQTKKRERYQGNLKKKRRERFRTRGGTGRECKKGYVAEEGFVRRGEARIVQGLSEKGVRSVTRR